MGRCVSHRARVRIMRSSSSCDGATKHEVVAPCGRTLTEGRPGTPSGFSSLDGRLLLVRRGRACMYATCNY